MPREDRSAALADGPDPWSTRGEGRGHLPFPVGLRSILVLYALLALLFALTTPPWQNPDEPAHYNYIAHLAETLRFPVLRMGDYDQAYLQELMDAGFPPDRSVAPLRYEFHQPPLYYLLVTPVFWASGGELWALRLASVLLGAGVILLIARCAQIVCPRRPHIALGAAAFGAFLPMHLALLAAVNNDALAELLITGAVLVLLRWLQSPIRSRHLVLFSLLMGLGFLTKATAYLLLPVGVLTVLWAHRGQGSWPRSPSRALADLARLTGPGLLLGLPWWLRNIRLYGPWDFLGLAWHKQVVTGQPTTADWIAQYGWSAYLDRAWSFTFSSFWGVFGWMGIFMDSRIYITLEVFSGILLLGGIVGLVRRGGYLAAVQRRQLLLLGLLAGGTLASYIWYNLDFVQHQGRYLFPALVSWSLAASLGWDQGTRPQTAGRLGLVLLSVALAMGLWGVFQGTVDRWRVLIWGGAGAALVAYGWASIRLGQSPRFRPWAWMAPWISLILLDMAIPFMYTG